MLSPRPLKITPLESHMVIFSFLKPNARSKLVQAIAEAPAPLTTKRTSAIFFPIISKPFNAAAPTIIAVPCWSSWNTGIPIRSRNAFSMWKHSGALISSRLIPPKVGSNEAIISINLSGSCSLISISNTLMPANFLNNTPFPSITGFDASAPIFPNPNTAVPFEITATKLARAV